MLAAIECPGASLNEHIKIINSFRVSKSRDIFQTKSNLALMF